MDNYDLEIENKKLQLQKEATIVVGAMFISAVLGVGGAFVLHSCIKSTSLITWEEVKESSIVITKDNNYINYHIVKNNEEYYYYDLINSYNINPDTIIYTIDTTSYLVNIDNVKTHYSTEELKEILKEFSMNQDYTVSDDTVKILVKEK